MNRSLAALSLAVLVAACSDAPAPGAAAAGVPAGEVPLASYTATPVSRPALAGRSREVVNPDESTVVLLYLDLAGVPLRLDQWVEDDMRVKLAPPIDKPAQRSVVRAEFESAANAVRDIGLVRLSLADARLSDYDPTYGEFTIGAFAPSSMVEFRALGQTVAFRFGNGRTAQIWRVSPGEAQAIRDRIGSRRSVSVDALLAVREVQPGPSGGTIVVDVLEYELRDPTTGTALVRVDLTATPPAA